MHIRLIEKLICMYRRFFFINGDYQLFLTFHIHVFFKTILLLIITLRWRQYYHVLFYR